MTHTLTKYHFLSNSIVPRKRWLAYLDMLGVKNLINSGKMENVIYLYERAVEELEKIVGAMDSHAIKSMWFSDTFIIYSTDDSSVSFTWIELATRLFFDKLILSKIPVRGAISIGNLYTNKKKGVIVGDALISAYEYGETQDWIGLILTKQTTDWMYDNDLNPNERLDYARLYDEEVLKSVASSEIFAYRMSKSSPYNIEQQEIYRTIEELGKKAPKKVWPKYKRTLQFIRKNKLSFNK